ncbi:unnamed protein product [Ixodes pacificus]
MELQGCLTLLEVVLLMGLVERESQSGGTVEIGPLGRWRKSGHGLRDAVSQARRRASSEFERRHWILASTGARLSCVEVVSAVDATSVMEVESHPEKDCSALGGLFQYIINDLKVSPVKDGRVGLSAAKSGLSDRSLP